MTNKLLLALLFITIQATSVLAQTSADQLKDEFIKTYNPDGYNAYHSALDLRDRGLSLVSSLKNGLNQNIRLTESFDPSAILNDFNRQIQNIEALEANFNKETNSYDFNAGQSIGNSINSGNYDQALMDGLGFLTSLEGRNEARRQADAQKASLRRERDVKMGKAYTKAQDYNNQTILEYAKAAAFAESIAEEKYFHSYVLNLECFSKNMTSNFSTSNSYWLTNNCTEPIKNEFSGIENTFVTKDVQYLNIAKRKYKRFEETNYEAYRDAAIAFTAAVADEKPSAKLFAKIGDYYVGKSTILALTNYLTAQTYDKNILTGERIHNLELVKSQSEQEIKYAIETNNKAFLNAFLNSNLDKTISIQEKSILNYAIWLDQPDAVQIILNKYTKGKSQAIVQERLKKTVMMAAIYNSPDVIKRIQELGVPIDFEMKGYRPIEVAEKSISIQVFDYYIENLEDGSELLKQYKSSNSDLFKCKELFLIAGMINPSTSTKQVVTNLIETRKIMGAEKFKAEGFTNKKAYEKAILMIDAFEKTEDELTLDISQKYNELKSNSAKIKVIEALIEVDEHTSVMDILNNDPAKEAVVEKDLEFHETILDKRALQKAVNSGTKEAYTRLLLNTKNIENKALAMKEIVDLKNVPTLIAALNSQNKCGFYNEKGEVVIPFIYNRVRPFSDGLALVSKKGKFGFIDKSGNLKIPLQFNNAWSFYDGIAIVSDKDDNFFSINTNGEKITDFGLVIVIYEGTSLLVVQDGAKEYLMHRNGKMITDKYQYFQDIPGSKSISSKAIMARNPDKTEITGNALAILYGVGEANTKMITGKVGFIDYEGNALVAPKYSDALPNFSNDLFFVKKESHGKFGIVNSNNEELTDFIYDVYTHGGTKYITPHGEAKVAVDGVQMYIDKNGNIIDKLKPYTKSNFISGRSGIIYENNFTETGKMTWADLGLINSIPRISYSQVAKRKKVTYGLKRDNVEFITPELNFIIGFNFDHIQLELDGKTFYVNIHGDIVDHK
jgi:hypothetical protein